MNLSCKKCNSTSIINLFDENDEFEYEFNYLCLECGFEWDEVSKFNSIDDFEINWRELILNVTTFKNENEIEYLSEIKKYCNNGGMPKGILAKIFNFNKNLEFENLLQQLPKNIKLQNDFIEDLFIKSDINKYLNEFHSDKNELQILIKNAKFKILKPHKIEKKLADYLYYYGMYNWFKDNNTYEQAITITRNFCDFTFQSNIKNVICFTSQLPFGKWFDINSCSDFSLVLINLKIREIYLFCFSHSD